MRWPRSGTLMTSDLLFVYGTLMRGFDHPMAQLLSRSAEFIGEARCQGRLYLVKHYPGMGLSADPRRSGVRRTLSIAAAARVAARTGHVRGLRRGLRRADRICQANAAGRARRRRGGSVDLSLQLAR